MERADLNVIQYVARVTPLFWVVVGLAVAIAAGDVLLLVIARRRRSLCPSEKN